MRSDPYLKRVKDIMVRDVVFGHPEDSLGEAVALMVENRVSALPVLSGQGRCVGVISVTDLVGLSQGLSGDSLEVDEPAGRMLLEKLAQNDLNNRQIQQVMTTDLVAVDPETPLCGAGQEMLRHRVHRLVVVDQRERLIGIVSTMDLLRAFVEGEPEDADVSSQCCG